MKDVVLKAKDRIKKTISNINFKSKKTLLLIGLFVVMIASGAILISYGFYSDKGPNTLVVGGYVSLSDADIELKIYLENRDEDGYGDGSYSRIYYLPKVNYEYNASKTICTVGLSIDGYNDGKFTLSGDQKGFCKVYFDASLEGPEYIEDSTFRLFIEQTKGAKDYEEAGTLPVNYYKYKVNSDLTTCSDSSASVDIYNRKIRVTASKSTNCTIYVDVEATTGGMPISFYIDSLESSSDYISSQNGSIYRVVDQNGIRYEGQNPDNYVYYNCTDINNPSTCEMWRIIGTFDGADIGLTEGEKYTKIIRNDFINKEFAWDSGNENDWENSSLKAYLNGEYFNSLSSSAQAMIAKENGTYSKWHLLGPDNSTYIHLSAADWYKYERNASYGKPGYKYGVQYGAAASVNAAVGLMYPSDYGYAAYGKQCDSTIPLYMYEADTGCSIVNWLVNGNYYEWLISPRNDSAYYTFRIDDGSDAYVYSHEVNSTNDMSGRPTVYLRNDVAIGGGDGSRNNPYVLEAPTNYLSKQVLSLVSSQDYISSQDGSIYRVVDQNGVRYEGADPDNYVYYNCSNDKDPSTCEKWRIIGVFDGSEIGLTTGKKYTKIIKSIPLENKIAWDTDGENDWVNSSLNAYLNGTYLSGLSASAQGMIAKENNTYSGWYLLGPGSEHTGLYSQDWYKYERNSAYGKPGYKDGTQYGALGYTNAAIGLMYPSDYGYAAYGTDCDNEMSLELSGYDSFYDNRVPCGSVDWLLNTHWREDLNQYGSEWLITPRADRSNGVFVMDSDIGGNVYDSNANLGSMVRPVLYLSSDVLVSDGNGSSSSPYKISLNLSDITTDITPLNENEYEVVGDSEYFFFEDGSWNAHPYDGEAMVDLSASINIMFDVQDDFVFCYNTGYDGVEYYTMYVDVYDSSSGADNIIKQYTLVGEDCSSNVFEYLYGITDVGLRGGMKISVYQQNGYDSGTYFYIGRLSS